MNVFKYFQYLKFLKYSVRFTDTELAGELYKSFFFKDSFPSLFIGRTFLLVRNTPVAWLKQSFLIGLIRNIQIENYENANNVKDAYEELFRDFELVPIFGKSRISQRLNLDILLLLETKYGNEVKYLKSDPVLCSKIEDLSNFETSEELLSFFTDSTS